MSTSRKIMAGTVLALSLALPALVACGRGSTPGGSGTPTPPVSPSVAITQSPSAAPTTPAPAPTPTATVAPTGWTVLSARVAYPWRWPNGNGPATVSHSYPVPPVPKLIQIGAGDHPSDPGERAFQRMSFTFTTAFPSYRFEFVDRLVGDGNGQPIPLEGLGVLKVVFVQAQAHTDDGTASTIASQPPRHLGYHRMVSYAQAGDFEGYLTYGIGIAWPIPHSNPQIAVRAYEVTMVNGAGQHRYVIAIDVDAR